MQSVLFSVVASLSIFTFTAWGQPPLPPATQPPKPSGSQETKDITADTKLGGKNLDEWIRDTQHQAPSIRQLAIQSIPWYQKAAAKAVPYLADRLTKDSDASVRVYAAMALGGIPMADKQDIQTAVTALASRLGGDPNNPQMAGEDPQATIRFHAAAALARLGANAKPAIPRLRNAVLDANSWEIRKAAVDALGQAAPSPTGPDSNCIASLVGHSIATRAGKFAARLPWYWRRSVPPTQQADIDLVVRALQKNVNSEHEELVNIASLVALMRMTAAKDQKMQATLAQVQITPDRIMEVVAGVFLKNPRPAVRMHALAALGEFASSTQRFIPNMIEALKDSNPEVVMMAIGALGQEGTQAQKAIDPLTQLMEQHKGADDPIGYAAKIALEKIKGQVKPPITPPKP